MNKCTFGTEIANRKRLCTDRLLPEIICKDGFKMSVQVSSTHYCDPRNNTADYYSEVEVGFPSDKEPLLMQWAEDPHNPTGTVYGYVPSNIIQNIIQKHGGEA